jgi:hypothetical protein
MKGFIQLQINQIVLVVIGVIMMILILTFMRQVPGIYDQIPLFKKGQGGVSATDMRSMLAHCNSWYANGDFVDIYMPKELLEIAPKVTSSDTLCRGDMEEGSKSACRALCISLIHLGDTCAPESPEFGFGCLNPIARGAFE